MKFHTRPAVEREYRSHMDYDTMPVEELCKPLSAKITPKARLYTVSGREATNEHNRNNKV